MTSPTLLWCELAWTGGPGAAAGVVLEVRHGRFAAVSTGVPAPPPGAERLPGLVLPGFANGHSHAFHRALRGRTHQGRGTFWTWREQMYAVASSLTPERYLALARATFAEMVLAGITAVGEFHYLHHGPGGVPYADPNEMTRVLVQAAAEAGLRITVLDTCYLHGGIDAPGRGLPLEGAQRRFGDGTVEAWAARVDALGALPPHARLGAAVHSVRAVHPAGVAGVAAWARGRGAVLHAHVSEQPAENRACLDAYGCSPVELLHDGGAVTEAFTAVHATHLTDHDVALLGGAAACVCCCPTTERDLADGITPARRLAEAGASLATGSDSHAVIDPFVEARAVEHHERLGRLERGNLPVETLLAAATNHHAIGWADAGALEVGRRADLVVVSMQSVRLAGTSPPHAPASVVMAATTADVMHVMVDGVWQVRHGVHRSVDVPVALRDALQQAPP